MLRRLIAILLYGTPMAVCPAWREADQAEKRARAAHRKLRGYQADKARRIHEALIAGTAPR